MGKTTFAMNLCENAAMAEEKPVLIFSLEMPSEQIMMRMLASLARVDQTKIRTGQLDDEDWARVSSAMGVLMEKEEHVYRRQFWSDSNRSTLPSETYCP